MISNELVSVIVPVYNVEDFLVQCVESIIRQSYCKLEIILVDDGSNDRSGEICDYYSSIDARIRVIHKDNGGLSDARNTGMAVSTGTYITFIDSDDYISDDFIKTLYETLINNEADMSICDYVRTKKDSVCSLNKEGKTFILNNICTIKYAYSAIFHGLEFVAWGKLYKKSIFTDHSITFPIGKLYEDTYTTYKLMFYSEKIVYTNKELYFYRLRDNSITSKPYNKERITVLDATREACEFYQFHNEEELYIIALNDHYKKSVLIYKEFLTKYRGIDKDIQKKELISRFRHDVKKYGFKKLGMMKEIFYFGFMYLPNVLCKLIK